MRNERNTIGNVKRQGKKMVKSLFACVLGVFGCRFWNNKLEEKRNLVINFNQNCRIKKKNNFNKTAHTDKCAIEKCELLNEIKPIYINLYSGLLLPLLLLLPRVAMMNVQKPISAMILDNDIITLLFGAYFSTRNEYG